MVEPPLPLEEEPHAATPTARASARKPTAAMRFAPRGWRSAPALRARFEGRVFMEGQFLTFSIGLVEKRPGNVAHEGAVGGRAGGRTAEERETAPFRQASDRRRRKRTQLDVPLPEPSITVRPCPSTPPRTAAIASST